MNSSDLLNSIEYKNKFYGIRIKLSEEDTNDLFSGVCELIGATILENTKLNNEFLTTSNLIEHFNFIKSIRRKATFNAKEYEKINKIFNLIGRDLIKFYLKKLDSLTHELILIKINEMEKIEAYKQIKTNIANYIKLNFNNFKTLNDIIEFIATIFNL